jgi:hypothetical protein
MRSTISVFTVKSGTVSKLMNIWVIVAGTAPALKNSRR